MKEIFPTEIVGVGAEPDGGSIMPLRSSPSAPQPSLQLPPPVGIGSAPEASEVSAPENEIGVSAAPETSSEVGVGAAPETSEVGVGAARAFLRPTPVVLPPSGQPSGGGGPPVPGPPPQPPQPAPAPKPVDIRSLGPFTPVTSIQPGKTYLWSVAPVAGTSLADLLRTIRVWGWWDSGKMPPGWPTSDSTSNRLRALFTYSGIVPLAVSQGTLFEATQILRPPPPPQGPATSRMALAGGPEDAGTVGEAPNGEVGLGAGVFLRPSTVVPTPPPPTPPGPVGPPPGPPMPGPGPMPGPAPTTVPYVLAPGPYTAVPSRQLQPGQTYLFSIPPVAGASLQQLLRTYATANFKVWQSFDVGQVPRNWPTSDSSANEWRLVVTYSGAAPATLPAGTLFQASYAPPQTFQASGQQRPMPILPPQIPGSPPLPVMAQGPYTPTSVFGQPGQTYLWSVAPVAGTLKQLVNNLQNKHFTVWQAFDVGQVPSNWPTSDSNPNEWRIVATAPLAPATQAAPAPPPAPPLPHYPGPNWIRMWQNIPAEVLHARAGGGAMRVDGGFYFRDNRNQLWVVHPVSAHYTAYFVYRAPTAALAGIPQNGYLGQAPDCTSYGLPQAACDAAYNYAQFLQANSSQPTPITPANILTTFKQWWAAANPNSPAPPTDPSQYVPGAAAANLLNAAAQYWSTVGAASPTPVDPNAWQFPWQYAPSGVTDPSTVISRVLLTVLSSPSGLASLNAGQLPVFDPNTTNWGTFDPSTFATLANGIAAAMPALDTFVKLGQGCNLFGQTPAVVQQAWVNYMTYGGNTSDPRSNPCSAVPLQPLPGPGGQTGPVGPVTPVGPSGGGVQPVAVITGQPSKPATPWVPITIAVVGAGALGLLIYAMMQRGRGVAASENPLSYAGYRAALANNLINQYGIGYADADAILDAPAPSEGYDNIAAYLYARHVPVSTAARRIAKWVKAQPAQLPSATEEDY